MRKEIQKNVAYTFTWRFYRTNIQIIPTAATVTFYTNGGSVVVTDTEAGNVNIAADGTVTYELSAANVGAEEDKNYKAVINYTYSSSNYEQAELYDVVAQPIVNNVRDEDLFAILPELRDKVFEVRGKTTTATAVGTVGTVDTFIDSNLKNDYRSYTGGCGELFIDDSTILKFETTFFSRTTGTITFAPTHDATIAAGTRYILRGSFQNIIDTAYERIVYRDIRNKVGIASGYLNSSITDNLVIYQALAIYCFGEMEEEGDKWDKRQMKFYELYDRELTKLDEPYDESEDGNISEYEDENLKSFSNMDIIP